MQVGADDGGRHLFPIGATPVDRRAHPGEPGEPPGSQDGFLGNLAPLDRVPPQLFRLRDEVLGIEHEDPTPSGPHEVRVFVGVVPCGGHHRRSLVAEDGGNHEPLPLAYPRHSDRQHVVLRPGEQPDPGGHVDPESKRLTLDGSGIPIEGGSVSFDGLSPHAALDLGTSNFGFAPLRAAERPLSPTNQPDGYDGRGDQEQLGGGQRRPHGRRPRKKGARRRGPGQFRVTEAAPQAQEHTGPGSHSAGHDMVGAEGQRGQLAGQVCGQALTDDEADHGQERHERPVERTLGVVHMTVLLM